MRTLSRRLPGTGRQLRPCKQLVGVLSLLGFVTFGIDARAVSRQPLPGLGDPLEAALIERLEAALEAVGGGYLPRTEHVAADGSPLYVNRLLLEDSPYLRQHAHNPVNWYPWGDEAFAAAARQNKPVFLSIGYSTCHWCHVMERESFDNVEIARLLNQRFVCIKVDREQRPDLDDIYMTAVQVMTRRGGWPMSSFLLTDGRPFYGGTYFPPDRFRNLLEQIDEAWQSRRPELEANAAEVALLVDEITSARGTVQKLGPRVAERAIDELEQRYDPQLGGFGPAPKFPREAELLLLLDAALRRGDDRARDMAITSLEAMARGGIFDQIGGGFHRYSTDARWLVPHFEKMLYNQAHLARAYLWAYRLTGDPLLARTARQTLDYVLREMTSAEGTFFSATDADSLDAEGELEEGAYFVWTPEELNAALGAREAGFAAELFGVEPGGNFEGRSILHLPVPLDQWVSTHPRSPGSGPEGQAAPAELRTLLERVDRIRSRLRHGRARRPPPLRDDKMVTAWNGMLITTLAEAARILGDERYREAAVRAAEALWLHQLAPSGGLLRLRFSGRSSTPAPLEDYAYLAEATLALHDLTSEPLWLERARRLADQMVKRFWDQQDGGFFLTESTEGPLIVRPKSPSDGATPSANSVAVRVLAHLGRRLGSPTWTDRATATVESFSARIDRRPSAAPYLLLALVELLDGQSGPLELARSGALRAEVSAIESAHGRHRLQLALDLRPGWHINALDPGNDDLIGTELRTSGDGYRLIEVTESPPSLAAVAAQPEKAWIHDGHARLEATLEETQGAASSEGRSPLWLALRVQACNDRLCLPPEKLSLEVPMALRPGGPSP